MAENESYLDYFENSGHELLSDIIKLQAFIRGWLVRKQMADIQRLYNEIVHDIDGSDVEVAFPCDHMAPPKVKKKVKQHARIDKVKQHPSVCKMEQKMVGNSHQQTIGSAVSENPISAAEQYHNKQNMQVISVEEDNESTGNVLFQEPHISKTALNSADQHNSFTQQKVPCVSTEVQTDEFGLKDVDLIQDHPLWSEEIIKNPHKKVEEYDNTNIQIEDNAFKEPRSNKCTDVKQDAANMVVELSPSSQVSHSGFDDSTGVNTDNKDTQNDEPANSSFNFPSSQKDPGSSHEINDPCQNQHNSQGNHSQSSASQVSHHSNTISNEQKAKIQAKDGLSELPDTRDELVEMKNTMAMELLWVQQAINSRKHYLRLKQQLH